MKLARRLEAELPKFHVTRESSHELKPVLWSGRTICRYAKTLLVSVLPSREYALVRYSAASVLGTRVAV